MDVQECIRTRRSVRVFDSRTVPEELIGKVLEAGRWAPSGLNNQPWRFVVIRAGDPRAPSLAACTKYGDIAKSAGVLVAVVLDRSAMYNALKDHQAAGACLQNMMLAAHSLGLGSVWLGEILNQQDKVLQILSLDTAAYELAAVLALGWPAEHPREDRLPLEQLLLQR